ncbi:Rieske 2Fe-2S domain-containing protein [Thermopolyspora sp. NPDC052614]|uniref:Rieske 2Fe-2S domain-containing protein n=1 Tax=Thermopolyspora sp. NPDC052614 TaxID=3155682 RepID=UPI0034389334
MSEAVKPRRGRLRASLERIMPAINLPDRLERSTTLDGPIKQLTGFVRGKLGPGRLRDLLHGVPIGHPLHPMLATGTLGCFVAVGVLDLTDTDPRATRVLLAAGVGATLPTALAGATDWSMLHREQQRVGLAHAVTNVTALGLYTGSLLLRLAGYERAGRALGFAGLGAAGLGGYLGGHMSYRQAAGANHAESVTHLVPLGWHDLCRLPDLPEGRPVTRRLGYIELFVLRHSGGVSVLADRCSHLAGPLHQGSIVTERGERCVCCPWHGSTFRLSDGAVVHGPATAPQPAFETRIRSDGLVQVKPTHL